MAPAKPVDIEREGNTLIVRFLDDLTAINADIVYRMIENEHVEDTRVIYFDFSQVSFVDSVGIGTIIKVKQLVEQNQATLVLCDVDTEIKTILCRVCGAQNFKFYDDYFSNVFYTQDMLEE